MLFKIDVYFWVGKTGCPNLTKVKRWFLPFFHSKGRERAGGSYSACKHFYFRGIKFYSHLKIPVCFHLGELVRGWCSHLPFLRPGAGSQLIANFFWGYSLTGSCMVIKNVPSLAIFLAEVKSVFLIVLCYEVVRALRMKEIWVSLYVAISLLI